MKTLQQRPYDFSLNQELQQETMALMSIMKRMHTDDGMLNKRLQNQLDIYTHHKARKLELLEDEAELILEGLKLEEEQEEEQEEAQAVITSRSLDLTGIRFTDAPALDLSPTSSEESISSLILPVTEDATLSQEPVEVTGHARDCCAFDSSTMCTLL